MVNFKTSRKDSPTPELDQAAEMVNFPKSAERDQRSRGGQVHFYQTESTEPDKAAYKDELVKFKSSQMEVVAPEPLDPTGTDGTWSASDDEDWEVF
jgi:hypothetical protein